MSVSITLLPGESDNRNYLFYSIALQNSILLSHARAFHLLSRGRSCNSHALKSRLLHVWIKDARSYCLPMDIASSVLQMSAAYPFVVPALRPPEKQQRTRHWMI
jgi:hypothetical protein